MFLTKVTGQLFAIFLSNLDNLIIYKILNPTKNSSLTENFINALKPLFI